LNSVGTPSHTTPTPEPTSVINDLSISTPTPSADQPAGNGDDVSFSFTVIEVAGGGLSRTITAQLSNTGSNDAHDAWGKLEGYVRESKIKLSGKDYLHIDVGTLAAGAALTDKMNIKFSLSDGFKILQNGARFVLTVYSRERTQSIPYDYEL
jgi:hypothetical protein